MLHNTISDVYDKDLMARLFYSTHGINDWMFFIFFSSLYATLSNDLTTAKLSREFSVVELT
jgi:hypothetical protein